MVLLALEVMVMWNVLMTILSAMSAAVGENQDAWENKILELQSGINGTITMTSVKTPFKLLYGHRPKLKFDVLKNNQDRQINLKCVRDQAVGNIKRKEERIKLPLGVWIERNSCGLLLEMTILCGIIVSSLITTISKVLFSNGNILDPELPLEYTKSSIYLA